MLFKKILKFSLVFITIFAFVFSDLPQYFNLPLKVQEAKAAVSVVADSNYIDATRFEGQRKVFRNPRGQQNFYAFATINTTGTTHVLRVFRSADGITWAQEGTDLFSVATAAAAPVSSFVIREDGAGSRLIIYLVYGDKDGSISGEFYRRGTVADAGTAITWSAQFDFGGARGDPVSSPVIFELNNSFLCILIKDRGFTSARSYVLDCSTNTDPLNDLAWTLGVAAPFSVTTAVNASIAFPTGTKMPAGSTHNGVGIYQITATSRCGRPFTWNGTTFTGGTERCFTVGGTTDALEISVVPDTAANIVHVLTEDGTLLKGFKWTVTDVFPAATTVKDAGVGNSFSSLGLSIDTSVTPQKLHAFFVQSNGPNTSVLKRTSNADTIAWDTADTVVVSGEASAVDRLSISHTNQVSSIHLLYTLQGAAEAVRYHENSLAANPTFTQNDFRFYVDNNVLDPTDPWGNPDLGENAVLTAIQATNDPPASGSEFRIRMNITVGAATLTAAAQAFTIQVASSSTDCTTIAAANWSNVAASTSANVRWQFGNATSVVSGTNLSVDPPTAGDLNLAVSDRAGKLAEANPTGTNPFAVAINEDMEWDFVVKAGTAVLEAKTYCFRLVKSDGVALDTYDPASFPKLETRPGTGNLLRHGNVFIDEKEKGFFWAN